MLSRQNGTSSADGLDGKLDNCGMFDRALNATDIRFLAIDPPIVPTPSSQITSKSGSNAHVDAALIAWGTGLQRRDWDEIEIFAHNRPLRKVRGT